MRIVPRVDLQFGARVVGDRASNAQQRAVPRRVDGPHTCDRPRARAATEPQQDRLGLVVEGVPEKHRGVATRFVECAVADGSRGGFWPTRRADVDGKDLRINASQR